MAKDISPEILEQIQQGNHQAFTQAYRCYVGLIQFVVAKCGVPPKDCDDLVHEVFLSLWQKAKTLGDPSKVKGWLVVTARNRAMDYHRQKKVRLDKQDHLVREEENRQDQAAERSQHEVEVALLTDLIQEACRREGDDTLNLFYHKGLSVKDIAAQKGEAVSTVTTRLSRLRRKLKPWFLEKLKEGS